MFIVNNRCSKVVVQEEQVCAVETTANTMAADGHPEAATALAKVDDIRRARAMIEDRFSVRGTKLRESCELQGFLQDAVELDEEASAAVTSAKDETFLDLQNLRAHVSDFDNFKLRFFYFLGDIEEAVLRSRCFSVSSRRFRRTSGADIRQSCARVRALPNIFHTGLWSPTGVADFQTRLCMSLPVSRWHPDGSEYNRPDSHVFHS